MFTIEAGMSISTVQHAFNEAFPFLKLEFFRKPHRPKGASEKKHLLKPDGILRARSKSRKKTFVQVTEEMTVSELEQLFLEYFGISAQVFRKSGRSWLETTFTDDWTLQKQNHEGMELSRLRR